MSELLRTLQQTSDVGVVGGVRIGVGAIILMTGVMKFVFPRLREAWSGQLIQARIPLHTVNFWVVPVIEIVIGTTLAIGFHARLSALVVLGIMVVATYTHLTVRDPGLFPLQPHKPFIPLILIVLALLVIWRGGGAWSVDLRSSATDDQERTSLRVPQERWIVCVTGGYERQPRLMPTAPVS